MILRQVKTRACQRTERTIPIKPGWRDETGHPPAYDVLNEGPAIGHPTSRFGLRQAKKFAFAGSHFPGAERVPPT